MAAITHVYPANQHSAMAFLKGKKFAASVTANVATMPQRAYVSQGDVVQMIPVMKGLLVTDVWLRMDTSLIAVSATVSIGDGDNVSGYAASVSTKGACGILRKSLEAINSYAVGRLYTAADTIDIKWSAVSGAASNVSVGIVTLVAEGVLLEQYA